MPTEPICAMCLDGQGGECHTPGCAYWMQNAPDTAIRNAVYPVSSSPVRDSAAPDDEHLAAVVVMHRKELLAFGQYAAIVHPEDLPPDYKPGMKLMEHPAGPVREEWRVVNGVGVPVTGYRIYDEAAARSTFRRCRGYVIPLTEPLTLQKRGIFEGPWVDVPTEEGSDG